MADIGQGISGINTAHPRASIYSVPPWSPFLALLKELLSFFSFFLLKMNTMEGFFNHMNPSVLRCVLGRMNQQEFEECMVFIKSKALELPAGTRRQMFVSLFVWCQHHHGRQFSSSDQTTLF